MYRKQKPVAALHVLAGTLFFGVMLGACASGVSPATTGSTTPATSSDSSGAAKRNTPVVAGREARMYVMAGFREKDCAPITPDIQITTPPAKGDVTLKPGQTTTVQFSSSGACTGRQVTGTGIYYTARKGQTGPDSFAISAAAGSGAPTTRTFNVEIVD